MKKLTIACLAIIFSATVANAELFKWVDEDGVTHFSNTAPPQNVQAEVKHETKVSDSPTTNSEGLEEVLDEYRKETALDEKPVSKRSSRREPSRASDATIARLKRSVERFERDVDKWKDKLDQVKRESYSDKRRHDNNVSHCEKMLADYESLLEDARASYRKALEQ